MKEAIRLTNKTAVALRKNAQRVRTAHYAAVACLSLAAAAAGVVWGMLWKPYAVLLPLIAAAALDAVILLHGRSAYLLLIGQAICTEAAAREIRAGTSESLRREKAIRDLISVKADAAKAEQEAMRAASGKKPFFEKMAEKAKGGEESDLSDENIPHDDEDDEDMLPPQTSSAAPRRRRRQGNLQIIRSHQAK